MESEGSAPRDHEQYRRDNPLRGCIVIIPGQRLVKRDAKGELRWVGGWVGQADGAEGLPSEMRLERREREIREPRECSVVNLRSFSRDDVLAAL